VNLAEPIFLTDTITPYSGKTILSKPWLAKS